MDLEGGGMVKGLSMEDHVLKSSFRMAYGLEAYAATSSVAEIMSELVKASLGPRGRVKLLVDKYGNFKVTGSGVEILKEVEAKHPVAKTLVEIAKTQNRNVRDGVKRAVIMAGKLAEEAYKLVGREGLHPNIVVRGYLAATKMAVRFLREAATPARSDGGLLFRAALTSVNGFNGGGHLADIAVRVVKSVSGEVEDKVLVRVKEGGSVLDSEFVDGVIINKEVANPNMPRRVEEARILVVKQKLYIEKRFEHADYAVPELVLEDAGDLKAALNTRREMALRWLKGILESGANVVVNYYGIDRVLEELMARHGILAVRRADEESFKRLAEACGAKIVGDVGRVAPSDLGYARVVEERKVGGGARADKMVFVRGCRNPKTVSVLVKGGTWEVAEEAERMLWKAIRAAYNVVRDGYVVGGGGAIEEEVAMRLRDYAEGVEGREQFAIKAFANALEEVPRVLALNAGANPVDVIAELRVAHRSGDLWAGVDALSGRVRNMFEAGIVEAATVVEHALKVAGETTVALLGLDAIYVTKGRVLPGGRPEEGE
ncbi:MAG: thermosome subunit beta [Candidatus Freyarchaeota archaeon]